MTLKVYRYSFDVTDAPEVSMPSGARVLSCAPSRRSPDRQVEIWALVDPFRESELRQFYIVGTGNPVSSRLGDFVGTFSMLGGAFIGHLFEAPR